LVLHGDGHRHRLLISRRGILRSFAGLVCGSAVPKDRGARFSFGLTSVFLDDDMTLLSSLQSYLQDQLERSVALVKRRTQQEIWVMLLSGQLDAAWICDFPYVQFQNRVALLAAPLYRHQPLYDCCCSLLRAVAPDHHMRSVGRSAARMLLGGMRSDLPPYECIISRGKYGHDHAPRFHRHRTAKPRVDHSVIVWSACCSRSGRARRSRTCDRNPGGRSELAERGVSGSRTRE
jgi:phosphonate ABC transporter substrate-binding protein